MYHGKFPVEHGRVRTRLLGTPEYAVILNYENGNIILTCPHP